MSPHNEIKNILKNTPQLITINKTEITGTNFITVCKVQIHNTIVKYMIRIQ